jgi:transposase-like protein
MEQIKRRRLGADAWRAILERFSRSDLTVQAFCQQEGVSVANFYLWRSKLAGSQGRSQPARAVVGRPPKADFLDLGTLDTRTNEARPPAQIASRGFELRLDLGGGLQLHLVRS